MKEKKIKIYVPNGNPGVGFKSSMVKARLIHHSLEDKVTLMGYKTGHFIKHYVIVELTTGLIVAIGSNKKEALARLKERPHSEKEYLKAIKHKVALYGIYNAPLEKSIQ